MTKDLIPTKDLLPVAAATANALAQATEMVVKSSDDYLAGCALVKAWAAIDKQVDEAFDPTIKAINESLKTAREQKKKYARPLAEAREIAEGKLLTWKREDDARVARERAEAQEKARAEAEAQRKRELAALNKRGLKDMARELKSIPVMVPIVSVPEAPKAAGITTRQTWKAEVVDLLALVRFVARPENEHLIFLLKPDQPALNEQARRGKENLALPGVKPVCEESMTVRSNDSAWPE